MTATKAIIQNNIRMDKPSKPVNVLVRNNVKVLGNSGPVLLYAHGFGCNQNMWERVTPAFSSTHQQVLFDYVGCGKSDPSAFDSKKYSSIRGYAQDLLDICDALGLTSGITFVGHSVSCSVGVLAAIERPDLFTKMILLGPNPCFINHPPDYMGGFEEEDIHDLLSLMDQNYIGWATYLAPVVSEQDISGPIAIELSDSFCSTDPVIAKVFARTTFFADNRSDLPKVQAPCLILQHRHDALAPPSIGEYVHAHLAGSTLKVLEVQGHCAHMSDPLLVVEAMREYLLATPGGDRLGRHGSV